MHHGHFEMVRNTINRKLDESRMFAIWRIDAPWKPMTRKGQGHRMGGGKGAIDHYTTPVKAGRIIIEVGGECEFGEVFPFLVMNNNCLKFMLTLSSFLLYLCFVLLRSCCVPLIHVCILFLLLLLLLLLSNKQLVTQHMSVKNKLTNRSCELATAANDGKIC